MHHYRTLQTQMNEKKMQSALMEGDKIWDFCSPSEGWKRIMGTTGISFVRNDEVIKDIVITMN